MFRELCFSDTWSSYKNLCCGIKVKEKPNATQKEIAVHIGKSERTVKRMTTRLSERGIIERKNGKRNGYWEIKSKELNN